MPPRIPMPMPLLASLVVFNLWVKDAAAAPFPSAAD